MPTLSNERAFSRLMTAEHVEGAGSGAEAVRERGQREQRRPWQPGERISRRRRRGLADDARRSLRRDAFRHFPSVA